MSDTILEVKNLVVHYETDENVMEAVNNVSFRLNKGETLALVGETGAGKTTIALSIMGLLPVPPSHVVMGEILLDGEDVVQMSEKKLRKVRGNKVSMIFQDPMTALNPVKTIGSQIMEVIKLHNRVSKAEAEKRAKEILEKVGIPAERFGEYPHQFSGGMKQRVIIAMALACNPDVLIADEPTTALDVTIQAQVLEMMRELQKERNTALLLITHDFGVVADICKKCAVIYAGEIVEYGTVEDIFDRTKHPYTEGLFNSLPNLNEDVERLKPIPGLMADPSRLPTGCSFCERCAYAEDRCKAENPSPVEIEEGHIVKCFRYAEKGAPA